VARGKGQNLKQALRFQGIANLPWVASEWFNPLSLTHAVVAQGWLVTVMEELDLA